MCVYNIHAYMWIYAMHTNMYTYIFQYTHTQTHTHNLKGDKEIIITITRTAIQVGHLTIYLYPSRLKKRKNLK